MILVNDLMEITEKTGQTFETVAKIANIFAKRNLDSQEVINKTNNVCVLIRLTNIKEDQAIKLLDQAEKDFKNE